MIGTRGASWKSSQSQMNFGYEIQEIIRAILEVSSPKRANQNFPHSTSPPWFPFFSPPFVPCLLLYLVNSLDWHRFAVQSWRGEQKKDQRRQTLAGPSSCLDYPPLHVSAALTLCHSLRPRRPLNNQGTDSAMGKPQPYIPPLIGWLYDLVLWTFSVLIDLFFREVHPRGSWKIPRRGPIIIVAAPHANQVCRFRA